MTRVFISHSSKDQPLAKKIAIDLREAGIDVWLDEWEIVVGQPISQKIQEGLKDCHFVAVILTQNSISSGWVEKEWQSRIGEEAEKKKVVILPLRADNCEIPFLLRDKKYADFTNNYDTAFEGLLLAIRTLGHNLDIKNPFGKLYIDNDALFSVETYDLISLAIQWIEDNLPGREWALPLCSPKREGLTISELLRKKVGFPKYMRIPWGITLEIQPDIVGAIKLKEAEGYGLVVGMAYTNTMFEYDVIRARYYIEAADAYCGFVFWDMLNGFSLDGYNLIMTNYNCYSGLNEAGRNETRYLKYIMYSREDNRFETDMETAIMRFTIRRKPAAETKNASASEILSDLF